MSNKMAEQKVSTLDWRQALYELAESASDNGMDWDKAVEPMIQSVIQHFRTLKRYAQHSDGCPAWDAEDCTCGLSKIILDR